jgi:hypothetical protein
MIQWEWENPWRSSCGPWNNGPSHHESTVLHTEIPETWSSTALVLRAL